MKSDKASRTELLSDEKSDEAESDEKSDEEADEDNEPMSDEERRRYR